MIDPDLDFMIADLGASQMGAFQSVTLVSGSESCAALFDDGDDVVVDTTGERVQILGIVLRFREGAITAPAIDSTITVTTNEADAANVVTTTDTTYRVREVRRDPQAPGMTVLTLARA